MDNLYPSTNLSKTVLREAIKQEYAEVATNPRKGYHFHTGREALQRIGYDESLYQSIPDTNIASFAGTGNPFNLGPVKPGQVVVDVGAGAGLDALIAAQMVGPQGRVIGVDMTPDMLAKAQAGAEAMGLHHVEFLDGHADDLPLPTEFADILISNGVLNLTPDKEKTLTSWARVLKPGGHLYIGDILISQRIPQEALDDVNLWTG